MTPDKQQELLKRCLALQPLVGWPEWDDPGHEGDEFRWRLRDNDRLVGTWRLEFRDVELPDQMGPWEENALIINHEALCIWQDHLLGWLANRSIDKFGEFGMAITVYHNGAWVTAIGCNSYGQEAPTLIEALLDVCEQIQKGADDA